MKKTRLLTLLALSVLPLTACGTENIKPEEAVEKTIPALMKNTVDTYGESGCLTVDSKINSLKADITYGGFTGSLNFSGNVTFGLRNMYTTDASQLQIAGVLKNCNLAVDFTQTGEEKQTYEIKDFTIGAYLSGGNLYLDLSNTSLIDSLAQIASEYIPNLSPTVIKTLIGNGKFKIENVITNDRLPLLTKEDLSEEKISEAIKNVFGYVEDEDLAKIMTLTHDKNAKTYNLAFDVKDPAVVNNTYKNTKADYKASCTEVNLKVESWTNDKEVFSGGKINGDVTVSLGEGEDAGSVKVTTDSEVTFDLTQYAITNPSFSEFKSNNALIEFIKNLIIGGGLLGGNE